MSCLLKFIAAFLLTASIAGCATTGAKYTEMAATLQPPADNMGRIYFYRTNPLGAAVQPEVKLNGETVGKAVPSGFFYADRPAGSYEVTTATEVERKLTLTLEPGQVRYVRLSITVGFFVGHIYGELVDNDVGQKEIASTRYIGPKGT